MQCTMFFTRQRNDRCMFLVRKMQDKYKDKKKKLYMRFLGIEKAFDRVPQKVRKWATRRKIYQK